MKATAASANNNKMFFRFRFLFTWSILVFLLHCQLQFLISAEQPPQPGDNSTNLQQKPQIDKLRSSPSVIWVEEPNEPSIWVAVNVSCVVVVRKAELTRINWLYEGGNSSSSNPELIVPGANLLSDLTGVRVHIVDVEDGSLMKLTFGPEGFARLREGDNNKSNRSKPVNRYFCRASNDFGKSERSFQLKVGRCPVRPEIVMLEYRDGTIHLHLNETTAQTVPPVDSYRLEVGTDETGKSAHIFNKSTTAAGNYIISLEKQFLSKGEYPVSVAAHNAVGWSPEPRSPRRSGTHNFVVVPAFAKSENL